MRRQIWIFIANEQGAAALEYGLIVAGIALAFLAAFTSFGTELWAIANAVTAGVTDIVGLANR